MLSLKRSRDQQGTLTGMSHAPVISLAKDLRQAIWSGHPWLYDQALAKNRPVVEPGALVAIAYQGERLALGYADPRGAIAVRIVSRSAEADIDEAWATERAAHAARARAGDPLLAHTSAWRLIHGENDFMPGLVIDMYDDTAVVVLDGVAAAGFWLPYLGAVLSGITAAGVRVQRAWRRPVKGAAPGSPLAAGALMHGDEPPPLVMVHEHGARYEVDVRHGQKTGLFLDQRQNRCLIGTLAAGLEVMNLFCYTGGFSLHAALGGAVRVTSVDSAAPAMAAAERNFVHSELEPDQHRFVVGDAFEVLEQSAARGERYGMVIVDPPSFVPSERARPRGLKAYQKLNRMALDVTSPGGLLVSSSCSSHVTMTDMMGIVAHAAAATDRRARVVQTCGAASDHPVLPGFPESQYLKLLVIYVE